MARARGYRGQTKGADNLVASLPCDQCSANGDGGAHPGVDQALEQMHPRRKATDLSSGSLRDERAVKEPRYRALRHRRKAQNRVQRRYAAAAEVGDLGEGVSLASAVRYQQTSTRGKLEPLRAEAPC